MHVFHLYSLSFFTKNEMLSSVERLITLTILGVLPYFHIYMHIFTTIYLFLIACIYLLSSAILTSYLLLFCYLRLAVSFFLFLSLLSGFCYLFQCLSLKEKEERGKHSLCNHSTFHYYLLETGMQDSKFSPLRSTLQ